MKKINYQITKNGAYFDIIENTIENGKLTKWKTIKKMCFETEEDAFDWIISKKITKFNIPYIAKQIIERFIEDRAEFDIEKDEAIKILKKAVLEEGMDLNNETTSFDLEELMLKKYNDEYLMLQYYIRQKVKSM